MRALTFSKATDLDPAELADIRVEAMRTSLEAVGRFDPARARTRFLATYEADDTHVLYDKGVLVGFYVLRDRGDHLYLDHMYLRPAHQGRGHGQHILTSIQTTAQSRNMPLRLIALKGSPANRFYLSCGFVFERAEDVDNHYIWWPEACVDARLQS